ncbi:MAG: DUF488 family protein [Devosia sp.]
MTAYARARFALKRVYLPREETDGVRVLVDRLWPRGVSKGEAHVDLWMKDVAPSSDLRKWFGHDPERFAEFRQRYRKELKDRTDDLVELRRLAADHLVTLVYSAHDELHNQAVVLAEVLAAKEKDA